MLSLYLVLFKGMRMIEVVSLTLGNLASEMFSVANILDDLGIAI